MGKAKSCKDTELPKNQNWYVYPFWFAANYTIRFLAVMALIGFILWLIFNFSFSLVTSKGVEVNSKPVKLKDIKK